MVYKPGFPSGQRGWTQDPLRNASQVRILPPASFQSLDFHPQRIGVEARIEAPILQTRALEAGISLKS